jgi:uncharacterized protein YecE (DUF72 family)
MRARIYIGTSGWHYKHWRGSFYPEHLRTQDWLQFYSAHFNTVELNNSFYHLPANSSFDAWRDSSPRDFLFAVKGSRFITHMKKLKDAKSSTAKFFKAAQHLQRKLGPVLFQLPPRWHVNVGRLAEFLSMVPKNHQYVFEFRDDSWYAEGVYETLKSHNAALCIHDLGGTQTPIELTADFTYLRFHGPTEARYAGSYSSATLEKWADRIGEWNQNLTSIYAYFNNDVGGFAPQNAEKLQNLLKV